jgi:uncharacterized Tic20 family protein
VPTPCPTCGADADDDATVCGTCGAARSPVPAPVPPPPPPPREAHPSGLSADTRNWAMAAHLSSFLGLIMGGFLAFVGPLVIWLIKREEHRFIADHAREALNFNLSMLLYSLVAGVLSMVLIGIPILIALFVAYIVFTIIASVNASNGEAYRYPITIRFIS